MPCLLQRGEPDLLSYLGSTPVIVPSIVLGEAYYGTQNSAHIAENLRVIDEFAASNVILPCDETTARVDGEIKYRLKVKGRPIPENDIWIAAIAHQHHLVLVTRDAHFQHVDGLQVESW